MSISCHTYVYPYADSQQVANYNINTTRVLGRSANKHVVSVVTLRQIGQCE